MIRMIRADLNRILLKPTFYILIVLALYSLISRPTQDTAAQQIETFKTYIDIIPTLGIGIPAFLAIYSDEMKSERMSAVLGRGMSRKKYLIGKLLDALILLVLFFAVIYGCMLIKNTAAPIAVTAKQNLNLLLYCVFAILKVFGFLALAALACYATWNAAGGMVILILAGSFSGLFLKFVQDRMSFPIYDVSYVGLLEASFAGFAAGSFGWQIIPALLIYLGGVIGISVIIFNRKEIEF